MRAQLSLRILLFVLWGVVTAQRRGGGGGRGGSHGGGSDDDDDNDDYGNDSGDRGSSSDDGGGSSKPCGWTARQHAFGLPGLYYNGTLTIRHHLSDNTAWEDADETTNDCDNNDKRPKVYEYPAMLLIGPTANESDTNPMHWVLRGHQPAYDYNILGEVDFLQRWVYIRSSDFVMSNRTTLYTTDYLVDRLEDIDATDIDRETRVYWKTKVSSDDGKVFSARAEYFEPPPVIDTEDHAYRNMPAWRPGKRTSGYVTLNDVCGYDQYSIDEDDDEDAVESLRIGSEGNGERRRDTRSLSARTPTLWFDKGVTVEMENIGAEDMTWSLNTTMNEVIPWIGSREGGCHSFGVENEGFEWGEFYPLQSYDNKEENPGYIVPWNITVEFSLTFVGSLVSENSTTLEGEKDGKLLFKRDYTEFTEEAIDDEDVSDRLRAAWASVAGVLLAHLLLMT